MDQTKVVGILIMAVAGLIALAMGERFLADHWEDIKSLAIVALVVGGTLTVAIGGLKLRSSR